MFDTYWRLQTQLCSRLGGRDSVYTIDNEPLNGFSRLWISAEAAAQADPMCLFCNVCVADDVSHFTSAARSR